MNLLDFIVSTETARQNERFSARSSTNTGGLQIAHNGCYATPTLASEGRISLIDSERAEWGQAPQCAEFFICRFVQ